MDLLKRFGALETIAGQSECQLVEKKEFSRLCIENSSTIIVPMGAYEVVDMSAYSYLPPQKEIIMAIINEPGHRTDRTDIEMMEFYQLERMPSDWSAQSDANPPLRPR